MDYKNSTRSIGSCQSCRTRGELAFFEGKMVCDNCAKTREEPLDLKPGAFIPIPKDGNPIVPITNEPDTFEANKGDYIVIGGKRYNLDKANKGRCRHKVLDWLNDGPRQHPFCPDCGTQVHFDERARPSEKSNEVLGTEEALHILSEDTRTPDAEEGMAGLHGSDQGAVVGDRTETPKRKRDTKQASDTLAKKPVKRRSKNKSNE